MSDIRPLKTKRNVKANKSNDVLDGFSNLPLNQSLLLPILLVLLFNKSSTGLMGYEVENEFYNSGTNYKILDAFSALLNGNSKQKVNQASDMMHTVNMLRDINNISRPEDSNPRGFDSNDVLGIIKPLFGDQLKGVEGLGNILEMLSSFNNHNSHDRASTYKKDPHIRDNKRTGSIRNTGINKSKAVDIVPSDEKDDTSIIYNMLDALANRLSKNNN